MVGLGSAFKEVKLKDLPNAYCPVGKSTWYLSLTPYQPMTPNYALLSFYAKSSVMHWKFRTSAFFEKVRQTLQTRQHRDLSSVQALPS